MQIEAGVMPWAVDGVTDAQALVQWPAVMTASATQRHEAIAGACDDDRLALYVACKNTVVGNGRGIDALAEIRPDRCGVRFVGHGGLPYGRWLIVQCMDQI